MNERDGFSTVQRVRFGDLDAMRHLNNVVFLRYFETARIDYLRALVPAPDPIHPESDGMGLIFAECHIAYRSPVRIDEEVVITCSIGEIRRSSFRMSVGDRLVAEGYGVLVGYDYAGQRAARLPEDLRARLEAEVDGA